MALAHEAGADQGHAKRHQTVPPQAAFQLGQLLPAGHQVLQFGGVDLALVGGSPGSGPGSAP